MTNQQGAQEAPKVRTADYEAGWKDGYKQGAWAAQQPATSPAPPGWKLVPVEPTEEMLKAADDGDDAYTLRCFGPGVQRVMQGPYDHYCAMLDAAPTAQADTQPAQRGVSYAALPESFLEIPDVQDESGINAYYSREVVLECIDAALAAHGQAPAGATKPTEQQILEAAEKAGLWPNTVHSWIPAFHRYHKELAKAQPAQAEEPVAWAATSEDGVVEALGMNQSRRFDTPLYLAPQPVVREPQWSPASTPPKESDGEVLVRMADGRCEIAWATYWHGSSNAFAQWTFRDPDEEETPVEWMLIPHGIKGGQHDR